MVKVKKTFIYTADFPNHPKKPMPLQLRLSARAECATDVNGIVARMLLDERVSTYVLSYEMKTPSAPFPDVHFHVTFVAIDMANLRDAVRRFIQIADAQDDAHRFLETLTFADEFNGGDVDDDDEVGERV